MTTFNFGRGEVPAHQHVNPAQYSWNGAETLGGWVADTATVDLTAYVAPGARVFGYAYVGGNTQIMDNAQIYGYARVTDRAIVQENGKVYGDSQVMGSSRVYGYAQIRGDCIIRDRVNVYGRAKIYGQANLRGDARVCQFAEVFENAILDNVVSVHGRAKIFGHACLVDQVKVYDDAKVFGSVNLTGRMEIFGTASVSTPPAPGIRRINGTDAMRISEEGRITAEQARDEALRDQDRREREYLTTLERDRSAAMGMPQSYTNETFAIGADAVGDPGAELRAQIESQARAWLDSFAPAVSYAPAPQTRNGVPTNRHSEVSNFTRVMEEQMRQYYRTMGRRR